MDQSKLEKIVAELIRKVDSLEMQLGKNNQESFVGEEQVEIPYWPEEGKNVKLPERKKEGDIGYDAYTCESKVIKAHSADKISLGIGMVIPVGFGVHARNRSGNYIGKIYSSPIDIGDAWVDNNYRGIINALIQNNGDEDIEIKEGERVCSIELTKTYGIKFIPVETYCKEHDINMDELMNTNRGVTGFGASGLR